MKANRRLRVPFREDERGVAAVLGGVLIASIVVMAFAMYRVTYVPAMEGREESSRMRLAEQQLLGLKGGIDRHVENESLVPLTHPVTLGVSKGPIWSGGAGHDVLRFQASEAEVELSSNKLRMLTKNGTSLGGTSESWSDTTGTSDVEEITRVDSFRIKIEDLEKGDDGDQIFLEVRDKDGDLVGDVQVLVDDPGGSEFDLRVRTRTADLTVLYDMPYDSFPNGNTLSTYWIDMMDPEFRFNAILASADPPFDIDFTIKTLTPSHYAMTYEKYDSSSGSTVVVGGGGGIVHTDYLSTKNAGRIVYQAVNQHIVDQTWVLENGAVVIDQGDGRIFKVDPGFTASLVGNKTVLAFALSSLTGDSSSLMGQGTVTVKTTRVLREMYVADASRYEIKVTTDYPALWEAYFSEILTDAGLVEGAPGTGEFHVSTGVDWAKVSVYGKVKPVSHTYYDLQVTLRQANVKVELRP